MSAALIGAGLVNGALIGSILIIRGLSGRNRGAALLGGGVLLCATAAALILSTIGLRREAAPLSALAEILLTLAAGPLLLGGVRQLVGRSTSWLLIGFLFAVECLAVAAITIGWNADPIRFAVPLQIGFTLAAWRAYAGGASPREDRRRRAHTRRRAAFLVLLCVSAIHVAQSLRLLMPGNDDLRPAVPLTIAAIFVLLTLAGFARLIGDSWLAPLAQEPRADAESALLLRRLCEYLEAESRLGDPDLRLPDAAAALGKAPHVLQSALAASGHPGFPDYLRGRRIVRARKQLADPAERRTSIEAIGLGCGFRSRSAFYEAFRRETGMTPGAYRAQALR